MGRERKKAKRFKSRIYQKNVRVDPIKEFLRMDPAVATITFADDYERKTGTYIAHPGSAEQVAVMQSLMQEYGNRRISTDFSSLTARVTVGQREVRLRMHVADAPADQKGPGTYTARLLGRTASGTLEDIAVTGKISRGVRNARLVLEGERSQRLKAYQARESAVGKVGSY